jgi:phospholipase/lecithinase/hemolysin
MKFMSILRHYCRHSAKRGTGPLRFLAGILLFVSPALLVADDHVPINEIVVFGDSYSDTGNVYLATGFALPPSPPYFDGRFSNGPLWHEVVARELGIPAARPDLIGGSNYAWGGAQTGEGLAILGVPNLGLQIDTFLARTVPRPDQLFIVSGGGNDLIQPDPPTPPDQIVSNIEAHITKLAESGARYFAVTNLPTISALPFVAMLGDASAEELRRLTTQTNLLLRPRLRRLQSELRASGLDVEIAYVNWNRAFRLLLRFPSIVGVENTTGTGIGTPDPDLFFWFDDLHPSGPVHEGVGYFALYDIRRQLFRGR